MDTQSQDTARVTRIEAARQAALGTLSRARETLQVAATTVPVWARGVELRAGEQVDALLERVGLVRIAKVHGQHPVAETETAAPGSVAAEAPAAAEDAEAHTEAHTDAHTEAEGAATTGHSTRRRRR